MHAFPYKVTCVHIHMYMYMYMYCISGMATFKRDFNLRFFLNRQFKVTANTISREHCGSKQYLANQKNYMFVYLHIFVVKLPNLMFAKCTTAMLYYAYAL